jgi:hypothetical protein
MKAPDANPNMIAKPMSNRNFRGGDPGGELANARHSTGDDEHVLSANFLSTPAGSQTTEETGRHGQYSANSVWMQELTSRR